MISRLCYPEIEASAAASNIRIAEIYSKYQVEPPATLVDLLEVGRTPGKTVFKGKLDHDSLVSHVETSDKDRGTPPLLRVFFIDGLELENDKAQMYIEMNMVQRSRLHPSTASWMRDRFDVSPLFLNLIACGDDLRSGKVGSYLKYDDAGNAVAVAGFYFQNPIFFGPICHVWFSHDLTTGCSTYIVENCSDAAKALILDCARGEHPETLGRLCAIDAFIADDGGKRLATRINANYNQLLQFENGLQRSSPSEIASAVGSLHQLAQNFHAVSGLGTDLEEQLEFLLDVHRLYSGHSPGLLTKEPVATSLQFLAGHATRWERWAMNYKDRTDIQINLCFNLAAQNDSHTNLDIANFTSKIAIDTQRDSSSMITMAAVTMFFLPGTFISAIFSMVFFNSGTDSSGRAIITASPQWWYFIAITIPLTMIVFLIWVLWQRWRNKVKGIGNTNPAGEKV